MAGHIRHGMHSVYHLCHGPDPTATVTATATATATPTGTGTPTPTRNIIITPTHTPTPTPNLNSMLPNLNPKQSGTMRACSDAKSLLQISYQHRSVYDSDLITRWIPDKTAIVADVPIMISAERSAFVSSGPTTY